MKRALLLFSIFVSFHFFGQQAQHQYYNSWFRLTFRDHIVKNRIYWDFMLQHRRQAYSNNLNIFERPQLQSYWLWFYYYFKYDYRLSAAPFCYFETRPLSNLDARPVKEWRWCLRMEKTFRVAGCQASARFSEEFRYRNLYDPNDFTGNFRSRFMLRVERSIYYQHLFLVISNEFMLQYGEAVKHNASYFDQNRSFIGLSRYIAKNVKADIGYAYIVQERASGQDLDMQNSIWIYLTVENVFSRFKKKEAQPTQ